MQSPAKQVRVDLRLHLSCSRFLLLLLLPPTPRYFGLTSTWIAAPVAGHSKQVACAE